jgi:hypothetical protein
MARGAEVASLAGEGEQALMAAVSAFEARESGGEVAAAEKGFDGGSGGRVERAENRAVIFFIISDEGTPAVTHKLPERRGAGAAGLVGRWHKVYS